MNTAGPAHFVTYATDTFRSTAQQLVRSADACGFDATRVMGPGDLDHDGFATRNAAILAGKRGAGFWIWKPFIIARAVAMLPPGGILLYCDAGRDDYYRFTRFPQRLVDHVRRTPAGFLTGVSIGHLGPVSQWTKRDCLEIMGASDGDIPARPVISATWSLWSDTAAARDYLRQWQAFSEDPRCLTDMPNVLGKENFPDFEDHRHDQSINSVLSHTMNAPYLEITKSRVQRTLRLRPRSTVGNLFYKRPGNVDDQLRADSPFLVAREALRLKTRALRKTRS